MLRSKPRTSSSVTGGHANLRVEPAGEDLAEPAVDLAPRIAVAVALDRALAEHRLHRRHQRLRGDVLGGEQVVRRLPALDEPEALEAVEKLVQAQRARAHRPGELAEADRSGVEPCEQAEAARRPHQVEGLVGVEQQGEQRPRVDRVHAAAALRTRRTSSSMKRSISSSVL